MSEAEYGDRCSVCGTFYSYEDMNVVDTVPDEDGYLVTEILVCKFCEAEE